MGDAWARAADRAVEEDPRPLPPTDRSTIDFDEVDRALRQILEPTARITDAGLEPFLAPAAEAAERRSRGITPSDHTVC
jgi:hypothetical protein